MANDLETKQSEVVMNDYYDLDQERVKQLSYELDVSNRQSLYEFGSNLQNQGTSMAATILEKAEKEPVSKAQYTVDKLLKRFNDLDPDKLIPKDQNRFVIWFKEKILKTFKNRLKTFESTNNDVIKLRAQLLDDSDRLVHEANNLSELNDEAKEVDKELAYHIKAIDYKVNELETKDLSELKQRAQEDDMRVAQDIQDVKDYIDALNNRKYELIRSQTIMISTRDKTRVMQGLNYTIAEQLRSAASTDVVNWQYQFSQALMLVHQSSASNLVVKMEDASTEMEKRNTEMLIENIKTTSKAVDNETRAIESIELLKENRRKIMTALEQTQKNTRKNSSQYNDLQLELNKIRNNEQ